MALRPNTVPAALVAGLPSPHPRRRRAVPGEEVVALFGELESSDRNPRMAFVVPPLPAHLELRDLLVAALAVGGFLPAVLCLHRLALRFVPGRDAALRRVKRA